MRAVVVAGLILTYLHEHHLEAGRILVDNSISKHPICKDKLLM